MIAEVSAHLRALLAGAPCWYVSAGQGTWPSIQLALGDRIPRARPSQNAFHPEAFRTHDASRSLMAWSDWVLTREGIEVVTSAHAVALSERARGVEGQTVAEVAVDRDGSLRLAFTGGWLLIVRPASAPEEEEDVSWTLHLVDVEEHRTALQLSDDGLVDARASLHVQR